MSLRHTGKEWEEVCCISILVLRAVSIAPFTEANFTETKLKAAPNQDRII